QLISSGLFPYSVSHFTEVHLASAFCPLPACGKKNAFAPQNDLFCPQCVRAKSAKRQIVAEQKLGGIRLRAPYRETAGTQSVRG
ncbi:MAG: hypothetical protein AAFO76_15110, partial [Cyanobacteria bacterium J06607_15]